jgi:hypothetical protein
MRPKANLTGGSVKPGWNPTNVVGDKVLTKSRLSVSLFPTWAVFKPPEALDGYKNLK